MSILKYAPNFSFPGKGQHIGLFYKSVSGNLPVASSYIKAGLNNNEKCVYIYSENSRQKVIEAFSACGIETAEPLEKGQLLLLSENESYLSSGGFDSGALLKSFEPQMRQAENEGYSGLRGAGEMGWASRKSYYMKKVRSYEEQTNDLFFYENKGVLSFLCQYNLELFPLGFIKDMVICHPYVINA